MIPSSASTAVDQGSGISITAVHEDIIQTHILTRLDGPTLASASSASSQLHDLCSKQNLWKDICNSTWPSTTDPLVSDTISTFPAGHRSFFADSFPTLHHYQHHHRRHRNPHQNQQSPSSTKELISAIDMHYQGKLMYSKVHVTETETRWFQCSPFRVDLLDPKETVPTPVKFELDEDAGRALLEDHMTLSWIVIDPTRKRAANMSSLRPVTVQRHWLTGDIQLRYATIMASDRRGGPAEFVRCGVVVTCGGKEGGDYHVREVSLMVEDMDGKIVSGEDSLVILQEAMESGKRKKGERGEEREKYREYLEMKQERREKKQKRERRLDLVCMTTGVTIFIALGLFLLFR